MKKLSMLTAMLGAFAMQASAATTCFADDFVRARKVRSAVSREAVAVEKFGGFSTMAAPARADMAVDFTAGEGALAPVLCFNFDDGKQGWTSEATSYVTWTVKKIKAGTDFDFSAIDPADVSSLFVEGPYQTFRREKSSATSPAFAVPANGHLSFYVGFSQNYDDVCRLSLAISTDGFDTAAEIWNSKDETGEKPWRWHKADVDLSAYAGKNVQLRFTYGPGSGDAIFNTGGYLGDFAIDGIAISGLDPVKNVALATGERLTLTPLAEGELQYSWTMPGAVPETSAEASPTIYYTADGDYDITLTVTDAAGNRGSVTKTAFATVTGTAPVAHILPPATFRYSSTRLPMVAPLVPVTFYDASEGFPTEHSWAFTGVDADANQYTLSNEQHPTVAYNFLHKQAAALEVKNSHGSSSDLCEVSVEYSGVVTNMRPDDRATTFDMDNWGYFPGSNTRNITAYAEKFSKPSKPILVNGVYAFFTRADAADISAQIASVGVHICKSENGLPGEVLNSWWWQVVDLDTPSVTGDLQGTAFPMDPPVVLDEEFFIKIDGIPAYEEATADAPATAVTLGMASFRDSGNTTYMYKEGKWIDVSTYFPAGKNHTSLMVYPAVIHSVITPLPVGDNRREVGAAAGETSFDLFSIMGWEKDVEIDGDWLRVTNTPGDMTVDVVKVAYDALPAGLPEREANIVVTDGVSKTTLAVHQSRTSGIAVVEAGDIDVYPRVSHDCFTVAGLTAGDRCSVYTSMGTLVGSYTASEGPLTIDATAWPAGIYLISTPAATAKVVKK